MSKRILGFGLVALLAAGFGGTGAVQAQPKPGFNFNPNGNPNFLPGVNQNQFLQMQQQAAGRAAQAQFLPVNPGGNVYTPVGSDPYAAAMGNQYTPTYDPYYNPYNPYYADPYGGTLRGAADVMRAYGNVITSQEQARVMREAALQAQLETRKKKFDLDMYIKANTPTFTEEQAKIAKMTIRRIQTNASEGEVVGGKALNLLLDDMRRYPGKKAAVEPFALSEDVLGHLNLTKGFASLGILRNAGEFNWPIIMQELFPADQLKLIETQAKTLVQNAEKGKAIDVNMLKDMRTEMDKIRDKLAKKILEIPTTQYLDAKRFLNSFDEGRTALERGEASTQVSFRKWAAGGKNLQQLVDYMIAGGLKFAPAAPGDEFAYRAVHSGMAALDVALNAQQGNPETVEQKDNPP